MKASDLCEIQVFLFTKMYHSDATFHVMRFFLSFFYSFGKYVNCQLQEAKHYENFNNRR
jgi:hypothetical protein